MDTMDAYRERQEAAAAGEAAAFSAGQSGSGFGGGTYLEQQAYDRGAALRGGGGGGGPISPITLPFLAIMALGFWPICGALAIGAGFATMLVVGLVAPTLGGGWLVLIWLCGGIAGLTAGWKIEQRLAVSHLYRVVRHIVRLAWLGLLFVYVALQMSYGGVYNVWPEEITLRWIDSKLSPFAYVMIVAGVVLTHFVSRRFDDLIEQRVDPERAERREMDRAVRWRRMKIAFVSGGALAALGPGLYGEGLGPMIGSFIVFGPAVMMIYWACSRIVGAFRR